MDYIDLGPVPCDERCEQIGENYNPERARQECREYINQLRRIFGVEPEGAVFKVTSNAHDFGSYYDVVVKFDENNEKAVDYAFNVENNQPDKWDETAKEVLYGKR